MTIMNKNLYAIICILLTICLTSCSGKANNVKTHQVDSSIYSQEDIESAISVVKSEFQTDKWKGCKLIEVYYAGDEFSVAHNDWAFRYNADQTLVLYTTFKTSHFCAEGLNPNCNYPYFQFIMVRTNDGQWQHVDGGYG